MSGTWGCKLRRREGGWAQHHRGAFWGHLCAFGDRAAKAGPKRKGIPKGEADSQAKGAEQKTCRTRREMFAPGSCAAVLPRIPPALLLVPVSSHLVWSHLSWRTTPRPGKSRDESLVLRCSIGLRPSACQPSKELGQPTRLPVLGRRMKNAWCLWMYGKEYILLGAWREGGKSPKTLIS